MWVALQNWFTEYSYISTSTVSLSHDGKAFSWFWPRPWKRTLDFSVEAKPVLCFWSTLFSLLVLCSLPKSCGFLWSLIYLPTIPLLYPHLFPTYTHNYICVFEYVEPWFGLLPGKTFSFSELVSPSFASGLGSVIKLFIVWPCARYWSTCFTCLSLVIRIATIPGGSRCHHVHFAVRKWQETHGNGIWIQAFWP